MSHAPRDVPTPPGLRRGVSASAVALLLAGSGWLLAAPAGAAGSGVAASQPLVVLLHDHVARTAPEVTARRIRRVGARRPLTSVRTVLPVLGRRIGSDGSSWLHVRLPGRPSGHTGWIPADRTRRASTAWHITIDLSARRVTVHHDGRAERRFRAIVGKRSTPTPTGAFFIEEALRLSPGAAGGPFALATSARSRVLQEFNGGPGQIALHGTDHLSGALGTAASHGCVRLSPRAITWLARRIGAGVPVTVQR
jgi:lipoprotein-anchoring transpeptidase ErfK/SrfK